MLLVHGGFGREVQERNTKTHEPEQYLQAVRLVELHSLELKQVLYIFECFLDLKAVVVDPGDLCTATAHVIGEDIPGFRMASALWCSDDPEGQSEQLNGVVSLCQIFEFNTLTIIFMLPIFSVFLASMDKIGNPWSWNFRPIILMWLS